MTDAGTAGLRLRRVRGGAELDTVRSLFEEYQRAIGMDLCFQGFAGELAGLPGAYASPRGRLYVGYEAAEPVCCGALRPIADDTCEMKRLYVREAARGCGYGRRLAARLIADARAIGYRRMVLDTLARMHGARALYRSLGFVAIAAYGVHPPEDAIWLALDLDQP